ncbi:MAG: hypothetical protein ACRCUP_05380 [Mycoplasmatales bacterium]
MKKIKISVIAIFLGVLVSVVFQMQTAEFQKNVFSNRQIVVLKKEQTVSNKEFVNQLLASKVDILIRVASLNNEKLESNYYFSNLNYANDYLKGQPINGCYKQSNNQLNLPTIDASNINLCELNKLGSEPFNLENTDVYYLGNEKDVKNSLIANGLKINEQLIAFSQVPAPEIFYILITLFFFLILILINIFYTIQNSKRIGIYKLNGLKTGSVLFDEFIKDIISYILIFLIVTSLAILYLFWIDSISSFKNIFLTFVTYSITALVISELFLLIITVYYYQKTKIVEILKNKMNFSLANFFLMFFKYVFTIIGIGGIFFTFNLAIQNSELNKNVNKFSEIGNYYTISENFGTENCISSKDECSTRYAKFYEKFNKEMDGILVDSSNLNTEYCKSNPIECTMDVNKNYLQKNNVVLADGTPFDPATLNDTDGYVLIPEKFKKYEEQIVDRRSQIDEMDKSLKMKPIYIQNDQTFFTYRTEGSILNAVNPIVYVTEALNPIYLSSIIGNYSGDYFVKANNEEEVKRGLKEMNILDTQVKDVYLKQSAFSSAITENDANQKKIFAFSLINILIITMIIYFNQKLKLKRDQKTNYIKRILGFEAKDIYRRYFFETFILYGLLLVITLISVIILKDNYFWLLIVLFVGLLEILYKVFLISTITKTNNTIIKGAEW